MQIFSFLRYFSYQEDQTSRKVKGIIYYLILGYILSLFIKGAPVVTNLFMVSVFILSWTVISTESFAQRFSQNKINLGFILFFMLELISVCFSTNTMDGVDVLRMRLPLLLLPMTFCLLDFEQKTWRKILLLYAIAATLASIAGFVFGVYKAIHEHDTGFLYNDNISELLIGKQAVYMSFYINVAVFIIIDAMQENSFKQGARYFFFASLLWLFFYSFMLACKTSMVSLVIISLWQVLSRLQKNDKFKAGIIIMLGLIVGVIIVSRIFPKTFNRFKGITETRFRFDNKNAQNHFNAEFDTNKWNSTNTRIALWSCGMDIWKKHPLFGTGIGDKKDALNEKYKEAQFVYALSTKKNLHNQYLDILVSMGFVGLLVFLIVFMVYPLKAFFAKGQTLSVCIFAGLCFCFFTENMLDRYQGEIIIAFMLPVAAKVLNKKAPIQADSLSGT